MSIIVEELHQTASAGRDDGSADRGGLERDDSERLVQGRHNSNVRSIDQRAQLTFGQPSTNVHARPDSFTPREFF
jgi:hypothetical protein